MAFTIGGHYLQFQDENQNSIDGTENELKNQINNETAIDCTLLYLCACIVILDCMLLDLQVINKYILLTSKFHSNFNRI